MRCMGRDSPETAASEVSYFFAGYESQSASLKGGARGHGRGGANAPTGDGAPRERGVER